MESTYSSIPKTPSKTTFVIAGILTTVYGLEELSLKTEKVACLWLLHPRLQTQACMEPIAASTINDWNKRLREKDDRAKSQGLIAVSFDQRNHGSRTVETMANEAWKCGNQKHAQDMFSIYHGTSVDTSHLITYISSYVFPKSDHTITNNLVLGISLGGHAAWHCLFHDPRITAAIVIIGCPDYVRLMSDRAQLSKLQTWVGSPHPGSDFLGSADFPPGLVEAVEQYDPAGLLLGNVSDRNEEIYERDPSEAEMKRIRPLMERCLQGKKILNLSGGADKLVPYKCGEPFLKWLKRAINDGAWFGDGGVFLEDIVFENIGHETTPNMVKEAVRFVSQILECAEIGPLGRASKI